MSSVLKRTQESNRNISFSIISDNTEMIKYWQSEVYVFRIRYAYIYRHPRQYACLKDVYDVWDNNHFFYVYDANHIFLT